MRAWKCQGVLPSSLQRWHRFDSLCVPLACVLTHETTRRGHRALQTLGGRPYTAQPWSSSSSSHTRVLSYTTHGLAMRQTTMRTYTNMVSPPFTAFSWLEAQYTNTLSPPSKSRPQAKPKLATGVRALDTATAWCLDPNSLEQVSEYADYPCNVCLLCQSGVYICM